MNRFRALDNKELEKLLYPLLRADDRPTAEEMLKDVSPLLATVFDHTQTGLWLKQDASQDDARHAEVDDQARDVNKGGNKRSRSARRIQSATAQNKRQHGACKGAKHDHADQAAAHGESDHQIVLPVCATE